MEINGRHALIIYSQSKPNFCLHSRCTLLMAKAEQSDLEENALNIIAEGSQGVIRSLACSLTAKWRKISKDARTIASKAKEQTNDHRQAGLP
jgi:hypothetical protein